MKAWLQTGTKVLVTATTTIAAVVAAVFAVKGALDTEHFIKAQKGRWDTEDRPRVAASLQTPGPSELSCPVLVGLCGSILLILV
jgi:hypothetical protein